MKRNDEVSDAELEEAVRLILEGADIPRAFENHRRVCEIWEMDHSDFGVEYMTMAEFCRRALAMEDDDNETQS